MPVARIARIGHQHLVARIHVQREREQQPARGARGDGDARGVQRIAECARGTTPAIASRSAGRPERRGVGGEPAAQRAHAGFDHRLGRGEVRLADLHVHHAPARRLERLRAREHVHHLEGLDLGGAARRQNAGEIQGGRHRLVQRIIRNRLL